MMAELLAGVKLLKLALGCTVGGFASTLLMDKDIRKGIKWIGGKFKVNVTKKNMFDVGNEHCTVIGLTQHGKTYATIKTMEKMEGAILFFNTNHTGGLNNKWVEADDGNTIDQVIYALKNGYKVNFLPNENIEGAGKQLKAIVDRIYNEGRGVIKCRIVIDEVHLFWMGKSSAGKEANLRLATTGLGRGLLCMWLSQRPAMVDNTLYTQSTKHIIFALGKMDEDYLKRAGFPVDEIKEKTRQEKYIFAEFDQKEVKGGFTIV